MISICNQEFVDNEEYNNIFSQFSFKLSDFQKHAIKGINDSKHVLTTAHTGSGKTLPAEYAIKYFTDKGKKVVYTAPIKALSNQKFYEFSKMFPDITFGLLTGDIKTNAEADVLIMTTEILRNTLFQKKLIDDSKITNTNILNFDMDIDNELGCVIFDEIHYINDADRGKVWEETIMMLPNHVQMLMLSATLDKQENFAKWISSIKHSDVIITSTNHRVVPLKHYSFVTCPFSTFKKHKNKSLVDKFNSIISIPKQLKETNGEFIDSAYNNTNELLTHLKTENMYVKRTFVLNEITRYLKSNDMLPAICFIFSRKAVEECSYEISVPLFDKDDTTPSIIADECHKILLKLPNYREYINLPEYHNLLKTLKKGIAIHHSGIMPIFREMVEILFAKGYIKLLFATETFAVGINMPTKTVLFTSLSKFDGSYNRTLLSHEYTQMAGRAGRRGLDTIGYVIHLNNLFTIPTITDYKFLLSGKPQTLVSKFKIHYNLILNLIQSSVPIPSADSNEVDKLIADKLTNFVDKSMIQNEIHKEYLSTKTQLDNSIKNHQINSNLLKVLKTPTNVIQTYIDNINKLSTAKNKVRRNLTLEIQNTKHKYNFIENDIEIYKNYLESKHAVEKFEGILTNIQNYTYETINMLMTILDEHSFIQNNNDFVKLTNKGLNSTQIQELHCLAAADLLESTNYLNNYSVKQICALFSCFSNIVVCDEFKYHYNSLNDTSLKSLLSNLNDLYNKYYDIEIQYQLDTGCEYNLTYDIINYVMEWCDADNETQCKIILQKLAEKKIFLGEFIKALLKINNIASELEKIEETNNKIDLLQKLRDIPSKTLKFVATNQSLYV